MKWYSAGNIARVFVLSLRQGDLLLESIRDFISEAGIKNGAVVSAIGTLDNCVLHMVTTIEYPSVEHFEIIKNTALELSSMSGFIANGEPHLHAVVSDRKMAFSGHVEENCRILYLGEVVIVELLGEELSRIKNDKGISLLENVG